MAIHQRVTRFLILSALGLIIGAGVAGLSLLRDSVQQSPALIASTIGGSFTLVDQDGITRSEKDYATHYKMIYFGFASCPAVCPTELQKMADAIRALTPDLQKKIQPLFITIDPERDTPKVLKGYVTMFLPHMVGLTGSTAQIEAVKNAYKVYAAKVPEGDGYTMDHSSFIYLVTPDNHVVAMFKMNDTAADMVTTLKATITP